MEKEFFFFFILWPQTSTYPNTKKPDKLGRFLCFGGADGDRTRHPLLAKQMLSHMSYGPKA